MPQRDAGAARRHAPRRAGLQQGRLIDALLRREVRVAGLLALAALAAPALHAQSTGSFEAAFGRESISAPLVRFAPNEPLLLVGDRNVLDAGFSRWVASGSHLWTLEGDTHATASARAEWKRSPRARDLDYGYVSVDGAWRGRLFGHIVGAGPTVQRQWVAGRHYRDQGGLQADAASIDADGGYASYYVAATVTRHATDFRDFDGRVAYASYRRHWSSPFAYVDGIDFDLGFGLERNRHGYADLDNRNGYARLAVVKKLGGWRATLAVSAQAARFEAPFIEGLDTRRDRYVGYEAVLEYDLAPAVAVKLEASGGRNRSSLPLYELRQRQVAIGVVVANP